MEKDILFILPFPWFSLYQRPHHFAYHFRKAGYTVNVVDFRHIVRLNARANKMKFGEHMRDVDNIDSSIQIPFFPCLERLQFQKLFKKAFNRKLACSQSILWLQGINSSVDYKQVLRSFPGMSILDVSDSFPDFLGNPKERLKLEKCEKDVAQEADIVFATADVLYERFRKYNFNTFHVPNGVDFDKYLNAKMPLDTDLIGRVNRISSSKVVGYQGAISSWFDFDLVEEVVRSNPELLFLFVGMVDIRVKHEFSRILKHANARYLGAIDPDALPWVISKMDVGIIPFKINDLIKATNPIKLYEYLAAGKPVLATSMPEVMKYHKNGIVSTAESPHTFSMILRDMVASSKNPDHVKERMKIASLNSWEVRFRQVMTIVDKLASSICQDS